MILHHDLVEISMDTTYQNLGLSCPREFVLNLYDYVWHLGVSKLKATLLPHQATTPILRPLPKITKRPFRVLVGICG